jgi:hypothetical protein
VVDTREQAGSLNAAIRDRLVTAGVVDDRRTVSIRAGQPAGAGDLVATRRNDHQLDVANRDSWTVTHVLRDGALTVTSSDGGRRELPADYVREHVELAYATTAHGAQGSTTTAAHLVLGDHTTAASAYVAMTRGHERNVIHVAPRTRRAREQWVDAFARDRADRCRTPRACGTRGGHGRPGPPARPGTRRLRGAWGERPTSNVSYSAPPRSERLAEVIAPGAAGQALAVLGPAERRVLLLSGRARPTAAR